jgi:hypothetical protein
VAERSLDSVEIGRIGLRVGFVGFGERSRILGSFLQGLGVRFLGNFRVAIQLKHFRFQSSDYSVSDPLQEKRRYMSPSF